MRLVITNEDGEKNGVLIDLDLERYDLSSELDVAIVVAWIDETVKEIKRGEGNDG